MDRDEFVRTAEQQRRGLERTASGLVGRGDAPDVVQSTIMRVFAGNKWQDMDAEHLARYLTIQVRDDARDCGEAMRRSVDHEAGFVARLTSSAVTEDDLAQRVDLQRALEALPADERAAVLAVLAEGATVREHAEGAGVPKSTAHDLVRRGLEKLRAHLGARTNGPSAPVQEEKDDDESEGA